MVWWNCEPLFSDKYFEKTFKAGGQMGRQSAFVYCVGAAIIPALIVSIAIHDLWVR